jgi:hypothetical protein
MYRRSTEIERANPLKFLLRRFTIIVISAMPMKPIDEKAIVSPREHASFLLRRFVIIIVSA